MAVKFGKKYKKLPIPSAAIIAQEIVDWVFATLAAGTLLVPDEWTWWKYVIAGSGALAGLWNKLKPYFGVVTEFPVDPNADKHE